MEASGRAERDLEADGASTRETVERTVVENPGIGPTEIARKLDLSVPTVLYHLRVLTQEGRVAWMRWGQEIHCFPPEVPVPVRHTLAVISREPARRIALNILDRPFQSLRERSAEIGVSHQAIHQQIERMRAAGLVVPVHDEKGRRGWMLGESMRSSLRIFLTVPYVFDGRLRRDDDASENL